MGMKAWLIIAVGALCFVIGWLVHGGAPCPEVTGGGGDTTTTIVVHDTVRDTVWRDSIRIRTISKTKTVRDTIWVSNKAETVLAGPVEGEGNFFIEPNGDMNCISAEYHVNGAYIKPEFCSEHFPKDLPDDIVGTIEYEPAPDTTKTIKIPVQKPAYTGLWAGAAFVTGVLLAILIGGML